MTHSSKNVMNSLKRQRKELLRQKQLSGVWRSLSLLIGITSVALIILLLSGCETLRVLGEPPKPDPTPEMLLRCPEELPSIQTSEEQWYSLTADQQLQMLLSLYNNEWSSAYYRCAIRHNSLVEYHVVTADNP